MKSRPTSELLGMSKGELVLYAQDLQLELERLQEDDRREIGISRKLKETCESYAATVKELRLILRGMICEHYHIRFEITGTEVVASDALRLSQALMGNYVSEFMCAIQGQMGQPLRRLHEALLHISYLEGHARHRGVEFTPFQYKDELIRRWVK